MIVGENGVGKSNLLEAIRLVLDLFLPDSRRVQGEEDSGAAPAGLADGAEVTVVVDLQATVHFVPYTVRLTYRFALHSWRSSPLRDLSNSRP